MPLASLKQGVIMENGKLSCGDISAKYYYSAYCTFHDAFKLKCTVSDAKYVLYQTYKCEYENAFELSGNVRCCTFRKCSVSRAKRLLLYRD